MPILGTRNGAHIQFFLCRRDLIETRAPPAVIPCGFASGVPFLRRRPGRLGAAIPSLKSFRASVARAPPKSRPFREASPTVWWPLGGCSECAFCASENRHRGWYERSCRADPPFGPKMIRLAETYRNFKLKCRNRIRHSAKMKPRRPNMQGLA